MLNRLLILALFSILLYCQKIPNSNSTIEQLTLDKIKVKLTQKYIDSLAICYAKIEILKDGKLIDSIEYPQIEPVGSDFGLWMYKQPIDSHIIISKFGDYNGQVIIINKKGEKFIIPGGYVYIDSSNGLIFSPYYSDISGFSVFDLKNDSLVLSIALEDEPLSFFKNDSGYYCITINPFTNLTTTFKIDLNSKILIYNATLSQNTPPKRQPLPKLPIPEYVYCK